MEESRFIWVGGLPCLDFINTEKISQGERVDLIAEAKDLFAWLSEAQLFRPEEIAAVQEHWDTSPKEEQRVLQAVQSLRAQLRAMLEGIVEGNLISTEALDRINAYLTERQGHPQVIKRDDGTLTERFVETYDSSYSSRLLGRLAQTASDLLCHADFSLIRRCENPQCILFFYDTSKNHTRRWCSMNWCGNRAKAAAHYRKKTAV